MSAARRTPWIGLSAALLLLAVEVSAQGMGRPMRDHEGPRPQRMVSDADRPRNAPEIPLAERHRMTPEERRKLRQDVHAAGRDIYSDRMGERRREMRRGE